VLKREISVREKAIAVLKDYSFDPEAGGFFQSTGGFASLMGVSPSVVRGVGG
jgi:hypothetical protein